MDFHGMKRKELQALCKSHNIPANLKNVEMANRLAYLLKPKCADKRKLSSIEVIDLETIEVIDLETEQSDNSENGDLVNSVSEAVDIQNTLCSDPSVVEDNQGKTQSQLQTKSPSPLLGKCNSEKDVEGSFEEAGEVEGYDQGAERVTPTASINGDVENSEAIVDNHSSERTEYSAELEISHNHGLERIQRSETVNEEEYYIAAENSGVGSSKVPKGRTTMTDVPVIEEPEERNMLDVSDVQLKYSDDTCNSDRSGYLVESDINPMQGEKESKIETIHQETAVHSGVEEGKMLDFSDAQLNYSGDTCVSPSSERFVNPAGSKVNSTQGLEETNDSVVVSIVLEGWDMVDDVLDAQMNGDHEDAILVDQNSEKVGFVQEAADTADCERVHKQALEDESNFQLTLDEESHGIDTLFESEYVEDAGSLIEISKEELDKKTYPQRADIVLPLSSELKTSTCRGISVPRSCTQGRKTELANSTSKFNICCQSAPPLRSTSLDELGLQGTYNQQHELATSSSMIVEYVNMTYVNGNPEEAGENLGCDQDAEIVSPTTAIVEKVESSVAIDYNITVKSENPAQSEAGQTHELEKRVNSLTSNEVTNDNTIACHSVEISIVPEGGSITSASSDQLNGNHGKKGVTVEYIQEVEEAATAMIYGSSEVSESENPGNVSKCERIHEQGLEAPNNSLLTSDQESYDIASLFQSGFEEDENGLIEELQGENLFEVSDVEMDNCDDNEALTDMEIHKEKGALKTYTDTHEVSERLGYVGHCIDWEEFGSSSQSKPDIVLQGSEDKLSDRSSAEEKISDESGTCIESKATVEMIASSPGRAEPEEDLIGLEQTEPQTVNENFVLAHENQDVENFKLIPEHNELGIELDNHWKSANVKEVVNEGYDQNAQRVTPTASINVDTENSEAIVDNYISDRTEYSTESEINQMHGLESILYSETVDEEENDFAAEINYFLWFTAGENEGYDQNAEGATPTTSINVDRKYSEVVVENHSSDRTECSAESEINRKHGLESILYSETVDEEENDIAAENDGVLSSKSPEERNMLDVSDAQLKYSDGTCNYDRSGYPAESDINLKQGEDESKIETIQEVTAVHSGEEESNILDVSDAILKRTDDTCISHNSEEFEHSAESEVNHEQELEDAQMNDDHEDAILAIQDLEKGNIVICVQEAVDNTDCERSQTQELEDASNVFLTAIVERIGTSDGIDYCISAISHNIGDEEKHSVDVNMRYVNGNPEEDNGKNLGCDQDAEIVSPTTAIIEKVESSEAIDNNITVKSENPAQSEETNDNAMGMHSVEVSIVPEGGNITGASGDQLNDNHGQNALENEGYDQDVEGATPATSINVDRKYSEAIVDNHISDTIEYSTESEINHKHGPESILYLETVDEEVNDMAAEDESAMSSKVPEGRTMTDVPDAEMDDIHEAHKSDGSEYSAEPYVTCSQGLKGALNSEAIVEEGSDMEVEDDIVMSSKVTEGRTAYSAEPDVSDAQLKYGDDTCVSLISERFGKPADSEVNSTQGLEETKDSVEGRDMVDTVLDAQMNDDHEDAILADQILEKGSTVGCVQEAADTANCEKVHKQGLDGASNFELTLDEESFGIDTLFESGYAEDARSLIEVSQEELDKKTSPQRADIVLPLSSGLKTSPCTEGRKTELASSTSKFNICCQSTPPLRSTSLDKLGMLQGLYYLLLPIFCIFAISHKLGDEKMNSVDVNMTYMNGNPDQNIEVQFQEDNGKNMECDQDAEIAFPRTAIIEKVESSEAIDNIPVKSDIPAQSEETNDNPIARHSVEVSIVPEGGSITVASDNQLNDNHKQKGVTVEYIQEAEETVTAMIFEAPNHSKLTSDQESYDIASLFQFEFAEGENGMIEELQGGNSFEVSDVKMDNCDENEALSGENREIHKEKGALETRTDTFEISERCDWEEFGSSSQNKPDIVLQGSEEKLTDQNSAEAKISDENGTRTESKATVEMIAPSPGRTEPEEDLIGLAVLERFTGQTEPQTVNENFFLAHEAEDGENIELIPDHNELVTELDNQCKPANVKGVSKVDEILPLYVEVADSKLEKGENCELTPDVKVLELPELSKAEIDDQCESANVKELDILEEEIPPLNDEAAEHEKVEEEILHLDDNAADAELDQVDGEIMPLDVEAAKTNLEMVVKPKCMMNHGTPIRPVNTAIMKENSSFHLKRELNVADATALRPLDKRKALGELHRQ